MTLFNPTRAQQRKKVTGAKTPEELAKRNKKNNAAPSKKKTAKRKSRFKRGVHLSPKCSTPINYRSGWELTVAQVLDLDDDVTEYFYEAIKIPYKKHLKSTKVHNYIPDFLVVYRDGTAKLIEVKQRRMLNNKIILKKAEAARKWAESQKTTPTTYEFWADLTIKDLQKKLALLLQETKKKEDE